MDQLDLAEHCGLCRQLPEVRVPQEMLPLGGFCSWHTSGVGISLACCCPEGPDVLINRWYRVEGRRTVGQTSIALCLSSCPHVCGGGGGHMKAFLWFSGCVQVEAGGCYSESSSITIPSYSFKLYLSIKLRACLSTAGQLSLGISFSLPAEAGITGGLPTHPVPVWVSWYPNSSSQVCTASALAIGHLPSLKPGFLAWVLEDGTLVFWLASKQWLSPQVCARPSLYKILNTFGVKSLVLYFWESSIILGFQGTFT